jgi:hypothetical protein
MKSLYLVPVALVFIMLFNSCSKDGDKKFNSIEITSGEFEGFSITFDPNQGFWSPVDANTKYVHVVLGDDDNMASYGEDVLSMVFYYSSVPQITFPSTDGQWVDFGLNIDGTVYYFQAQSATLTVYQFDEYYFEGALSGIFQEMGNDSRTITFSMDISLVMQEI